MLLSMTGFGSAVVEYQTKKFTFEIKSLNSKQLDLSVRVPAAYRSLELDMRNEIAPILERGKAEMNMYVENTAAESTAQLNIPVMADYKKQIEQMSAALSIPLPDDWYSVLLRFPDTVKSDVTGEIGDEERAAILEGVRKATGALMEYRAVEGKKLEAFFTSRISHISDLLGQVAPYETERLVKIRARIEDGLASIPKVEYDKGRLEQEMIFYIEKLDITEEKVRLTNHCRYFREVAAEEEAAGRKLGFIAQEMGREINTLGSKANESNMQILVVKMKDELEKIKEQVLNIL